MWISHFDGFSCSDIYTSSSIYGDTRWERWCHPSRKSCYNFRVIEINRVVDGDTIDVTIDLGFDLYKKERVRVAGVDTPEKRTRDLEEKELGYDATNWLKEKLEGAVAGDDDLIIRTELVGGVGKYGRLLGWLYIGDSDVSLNEQMITEGYAWAYDGGTKQKNFEELREIRKTTRYFSGVIKCKKSLIQSHFFQDLCHYQ